LTPPVALTIAGSDSGAGAGIQADLKTFAALGVFGTTAVTALTAQNTATVAAVHVPPPEFLDAQISTVLDDFEVRAVKTGMLANTTVAATVARRAELGHLPNLVVDPVLVTSSGHPLLEAGAERVYLERLFPQALVVTPNMGEAALLVRRRVINVDGMVAAALELWRSGARFVVVKGGHLADDEDAVDVVFDGDDVTLLRSPRVPSANTHGTGCTFASAIAAHLAVGDDVVTAVRAAKDFVTAAIAGAAGWKLGAGHGPLDHLGWGEQPAGDTTRR
jgi:hydroxymethylpyrimidine/phosphomethylpyrimidine kinase